MEILTRINREIDSYTNGTVELFDGVLFSAYKLIYRINLYKNHIYPTGKRDSQGNYKYWPDIISPRVDTDIKNVDFDTSNITLMSDPIEDAGRLLIINARLKDFLRETGEASKLNEAVERGAEWGNVVWKKLKDSYKVLALDKVMVLNQTAETLDDSDVIEWDCLTPIDMRKKSEVWTDVEKLLELGKIEEGKTSPEFYIYERNGEITTKEYYEAKGEQRGDDKTYILSKIIVGGIKKGTPTQVLFAEGIKEKPYKEYHRGKYSGRWLRVGLYELLFDCQTRANEIGNQIARGLEWTSKTLFRTRDRVLAQNLLTDLVNGDVIKSEDLQQITTRMDGFDQLIADWSRNLEVADRLANSYEVVTGESLPSGTPFRLGSLMNQNANKLFDFIREKLGISLQEVIQDWIVPELLKDLKQKNVLKLTEDSGFLSRYYEMIVDHWYITNLPSLPPHTKDVAIAIKEEKMKELSRKKETVVRLAKDMWKDFQPRVYVSISGENTNLIADLETLQTFIALEQDPVRRTALIEIAMQKKNIDVEKLPKSPPQQPQQPQQQTMQPQRSEVPTQ